MGYTLITGASSGIGRALARAMGAQGRPMILTARRKERLEEIRAAYPEVAIELVEADLGTADGRRFLIGQCRERAWVIDGLVNNAGLGYQAPFAENPEAMVEAMVEVNMQALVELTHAFLPGMVGRGEGFILNIGSVAGFQPIPGFGLYAATKSFVLFFTEALHEEYRRRGVFIGVLCPGPVDTEFRDVARMDARWFARSASAEQVAAVALRQIRTRKPIETMSILHGLGASGVSFLPRCWVRRIAAWLIK